MIWLLRTHRIDLALYTAVAAALVAMPGKTGAQEPLVIVPTRYLEDSPPPPPEPLPEHVLQTKLGLRTWLSTGHSSISYAGIDGVPDVMSELHWRRVNNPIIELSGDTLWFDRLVLRMDLGVGTSGTGHLRDQDFDGGGHTQLASDTAHPVNGDNLYYFNLDVGWRIVTWHGFRSDSSYLAVDALLGWQHWSEKYVARDGVDLFPGNRVFPSGDVIASRFQWDSFRIGLRSLWQICERGSLETRLFFVPYTDFENNDIHYLRTDLLRDPTFIDRANGGIGAMADVTFAWRLLPHLGLELGYRVWVLHSDDGISITRTPTGDFGTPLNHAETIRHGVLLGLNWQF